MLKKLLLLGLAALTLAACLPATPAAPAPNSLVLVTDTPAPPPPSATPAAKSDVMQWDAPPPMAIDPNKIYVATFTTEKGTFEIEFFAKHAPITVNNFVFLARQGYYDGTTFHRVLENFMAQGGDPTGTGAGGPGYQFQDEFDPALRFDSEGLLAMANAGPGTNGSQFFITFAPTPHLNDQHTIFGKVVSGMDVVRAIRLRDPGASPDYPGDTLVSVAISEIPASRLPPLPTPLPTPEPKAPTLVEGRPLAALDIAAREKLFNLTPGRVIDPAQAYTATLQTSQGEIVIALHTADAPESVNNFVLLAELGYWDGFPFVYVEPGQFALTGSPAGRPDSDVGYSLPPEVSRPNVAGEVGYWFRADQNASSGSQFYLLMSDLANMDGAFTVFGTVVSGMDVLGKLSMEDLIQQVIITPALITP